MEIENSRDDDISALLSSSQRAYLASGEDSGIDEKSARERTVRSRIRKRLRRSIFDLGLLHATAESRDIRKAFDNGEIFNSTTSAIALIFDGLARAAGSSSDMSSSGEESTAEHVDRKSIRMFEEYVEGGVEALYLQRGIELEDINVSIDIDLGREIDEIYAEELSQLDVDELTMLLQTGRITQEEYLSELTSR
jgi:hypothetical protein